MTVLQKLMETPKEELVNIIFNARVIEWADIPPRHPDPRGYGKRIPYLGWFWRNVDFVGKQITIGRGDHFVGIMESNKWAYAQRAMTEQEVDTFIDHLEQAFAEWDTGGASAETQRKVEEKLTAMWDWFQTLEV